MHCMAGFHTLRLTVCVSMDKIPEKLINQSNLFSCDPGRKPFNFKKNCCRVRGGGGWKGGGAKFGPNDKR